MHLTLGVSWQACMSDISTETVHLRMHLSMLAIDWVCGQVETRRDSRLPTACALRQVRVLTEGSGTSLGLSPRVSGHVRPPAPAPDTNLLAVRRVRPKNPLMPFYLEGGLRQQRHGPEGNQGLISRVRAMYPGMLKTGGVTLMSPPTPDLVIANGYLGVVLVVNDNLISQLLIVVLFYSRQDTTAPTS